MKHFLLCFLLSTLSLPAVAQIDYIGRPTINYVNSHYKVWDINGLYFSGRYGAHSQFIKYKKITDDNKWCYGFGLQATLSFLSQLNYTTAATSVIKNSKNWFAFSFTDIDEKVDTLVIDQALNLYGNIYFSILHRFNYHHELYAQADLFGLSFGWPTKATLYSSDLPNYSAAQTAIPTLFNYTLLGSNNRGSLLYTLGYRYWFNDKIGCTASFNYAITEYRASDRLLYNNSRFRNRGFCAMIGVSIAPFYKKYRN